MFGENMDSNTPTPKRATCDTVRRRHVRLDSRTYEETSHVESRGAKGAADTPAGRSDTQPDVLREVLAEDGAGILEDDVRAARIVRNQAAGREERLTSRRRC